MIRLCVGGTNRRKIIRHDFRRCNIDKLLYFLGIYDWEPVLLCENVSAMYNMFIEIVRLCIDRCIPTKSVTLGQRNPDFVTPLVKTLLEKRRKLHRKGKNQVCPK